MSFLRCKALQTRSHTLFASLLSSIVRSRSGGKKWFNRLKFLTLSFNTLKLALILSGSYSSKFRLSTSANNGSASIGVINLPLSKPWNSILTLPSGIATLLITLPITPYSYIELNSLSPSLDGLEQTIITGVEFFIARSSALIFCSSLKNIGVIINGYKNSSSSTIIGKFAKLILSPTQMASYTKAISP